MSSIFNSLTGAYNIHLYDNGSVKDCMLSEKNLISIPCGQLIPKFTDGVVRQKYTSSVSFYKSGAIKRIYLENQTRILTTIGEYPAEVLIFFESGAIKRFFPLNGKLSGYWTEEDENKLCETMEFHLPMGSFKLKIISGAFYENGNLKSLTLWPNQQMTLKIKEMMLPVRIGFSLYENGSIKSLEPACRIPVQTPLGTLLAYDDNAWGLHADTNSLCFDVQGEVTALSTSSHKIIVFPLDGEPMEILPAVRPHPLNDDQLMTIPLKISFAHGFVSFATEDYERRFCLSEADFKILPIECKAGEIPCAGKTCENCAGCDL